MSDTDSLQQPVVIGPEAANRGMVTMMMKVLGGDPASAESKSQTFMGLAIILGLTAGLVLGLGGFVPEDMMGWLPHVVAVGIFLIFLAAALISKSGGRCKPFPMQSRLGDRTVIVTGANSGIGKEAALQYARWGAGKLILACRNAERGEAAAQEVRAATGRSKDQVLFMQLDIGSLQSVRAFVAALGDERVDTLIGNAGIALRPYSKSADGFESQYGTNHLGHFLLLNLLLPKLKASPEPRVVFVGSAVVFFINRPVEWNPEAHTRDNHNAYEMYAMSKLANSLTMLHLQKEVFDNLNTEFPAVAASVHPGMVSTNAANHLTGFWGCMLRASEALMKTPTEGAQTTLFCGTAPATDPALWKGGYHGDCRRRNCPIVDDPAEAKKLWDLSLRLVGLEGAGDAKA